MLCVWRELEELVDARSYDEAVRLVVDLREVAVRADGLEEFNRRLAEDHNRYVGGHRQACGDERVDPFRDRGRIRYLPCRRPAFRHARLRHIRARYYRLLRPHQQFHSPPEYSGSGRVHQSPLAMNGSSPDVLMQATAS